MVRRYRSVSSETVGGRLDILTAELVPFFQKHGPDPRTNSLLERALEGFVSLFFGGYSANQDYWENQALASNFGFRTKELNRTAASLVGAIRQAVREGSIPERAESGELLLGSVDLNADQHSLPITAVVSGGIRIGKDYGDTIGSALIAAKVAAFSHYHPRPGDSYASLHVGPVLQATG